MCNLSSFGLVGWLVGFPCVGDNSGKGPFKNRQAQIGGPPYPGLPTPLLWGVSFSPRVMFSLTDAGGFCSSPWASVSSLVE